MYAKVYGETTCGINGEQIIVEVDISNGLPSFDIVGLPDTSVKESRERVRAALKNSGLIFPMTRITVNLAPADLKKDGSGLDLPIAVGILVRAVFYSRSRLMILFLWANWHWMGQSGRLQAYCQ